tara:strand:- start:162 stop:521 length:360 start_codon:yes stop_codon:yes gene_type:complete
MATQKAILESVLKELVHIKKHMPNGELKAMVDDIKELKEDISELKYTLLNPDDGVIVKTNQNTSFRREMQRNEKDFQLQMQEVDSLKRWRDGVNKALWIIFGLIAALGLNIILMHSDKV